MSFSLYSLSLDFFKQYILIIFFHSFLLIPPRTFLPLTYTLNFLSILFKKQIKPSNWTKPTKSIKQQTNKTGICFVLPNSSWVWGLPWIVVIYPVPIHWRKLISLSQKLLLQKQHGYQYLWLSPNSLYRPVLRPTVR